MKSSTSWCVALVLAALCGRGSLVSAQESGQGALTEQELLALGVEAYIYGYPLVTMETTRRVMTNVAAPEGTHAPSNSFCACGDIRMRRSEM
jgi:hypothetical protein